MEIYLDNSATTKIFPSVASTVLKVMQEDYGNPSSLHKKGVEAEYYLKETREILAKILKVTPKEILFTSGGTESNNTALIGAAMALKKRGNHIISTNFEHASVYNPLLYLKESGFDITFLPVTKEGKIEVNDLEQAIREDTILVSVMHVNNEIGAVQELELLGEAIKKKNKDTLFHVDAIQSFGKFHMNPKKAKIDLLSVSAHKIHGPKGVGFLYIKDKTKIKPMIYGGGQQKGMRSGTDNVPGIAGLGVAAKEMYDHLEERNQHMKNCKDHFLNRLQEMEGCYYNQGEAPNIISVSFEGIRSEVLLHALEEKGIYVSSGSACSSNHPGISGTLKAIGVREDLLDATLRFSLCGENTIEQMDETIEQLKVLLPQLRRFIRK